MLNVSPATSAPEASNRAAAPARGVTVFSVLPRRHFAYRPGVLTEKNWPPEAVIRLLLWLFVSVATGTVLVSLVFAGARAAAPDKRLPAMIASTVVFNGAIVLCVAGFLRAQRQTWAEAFGFRLANSGRSALLGALACVGILPIVLLLGQLSAHLMTSVNVEPVQQSPVQALQATESLVMKCLLGFMAVIAAPVAEELFFRGVLFPVVRERGYPKLALIGVSLFFAGIHANLMSFIPLTVLAIVLTKLYEHTGNLLAPITTHALFNLANFVWLFTGNEPRF
jgi:membrane protease YdiL (CAAX protease family)